MPAAAYKRNGTSLAIQWTGSNLADIQTTLGTAYDVWTSTTDTSSLVLNGHGVGNLSFPVYVPLNSWLVGNIAYAPNTPNLAGVIALSAAEFAQTYTAA